MNINEAEEKQKKGKEREEKKDDYVQLEIKD